MKKDVNPLPAQDLEQANAEKHVVEIMGPPQLLDGSKAKPAPSSVPVKVPEVTEVALSDNDTTDNQIRSEAPFAEETPSVPPVTANTDTGAVDQKVSSEQITVEKDLDMEQLPSDFKATNAPDDAETVAAVDDILKQDSDALLHAAPPAKAVVMKPSLGERLKNSWFNWWDSPLKRYGVIVSLVIVLGVVFFVGPVRAMVLNMAGVHSSALVKVVDGGTNLPLQNANVDIGAVSAKTDSDGRAKLKGIRIGKHDVIVRKAAFATTTRKQIDFGMRIIDLGEVKLRPTGQQISYRFVDYLSGKPLVDVMVASGEASAKSDKTGKAVLTIEPGTDEKVRVKKEGYRTDTLEAPSRAQATVDYKLVPSARAVFVSKESGKYDVYKMYLDGKNREVLLAGTGLETQATSAIPSPSGSRVAVASSRDEKRNKEGYLLTALSIVDTEEGNTTNIAYGEQIHLLGWRGEVLVYVETVAGASAANPNRQRIIAYDFSTNKRFQLASANYFAGYELIGSMLYYTVSATDPAATETFARIAIDGTAKKVLFSGNVWSLMRTDYTKLKLQTQDKWYEYTVGEAAAVESNPVSVYTSRSYADDPNGKTSAWVDVRDAKGVLLLRNLATGKETELTTQKSMQSIVYWLNDTVVVYRVANANEVADYAVSVAGGTPKKISDVSLTNLRW